MNIHDHPNLRLYLAEFLINVRKHAIVEETDSFEVEAREETDLPDDVARMLQ